MTFGSQPGPSRRRDPQTMFVLAYDDGRTAYIRVTPFMLRNGDHVVAVIARARQQSGEIPQGKIVRVKRVR
jgi:hypothetical protein